MKIQAPFNENQIKNLERYQRLGYVHPFTCPQNSTHISDGILLPTTNGMICIECGYIQNWVHDYMTSASFLKKDPLVNILRLIKIKNIISKL